MSFNVKIVLTIVSETSGPFNIYSLNDVQNKILVKENVSRNDLINGVIVSVPDDTKKVKLESTGECGTMIEINVSDIPTQDTSPTPTPTKTPTTTPTSTVTPTITKTSTVTPSVTKTNTPTPSITPTKTNTPTPSITPTITVTPSPTETSLDGSFIYNYYFELVDPNNNMGGGTVQLNSAGRNKTFNTNYNLFYNTKTYNTSGILITANDEYVIDRIDYVSYWGITSTIVQPNTSTYVFSNYFMMYLGEYIGQYPSIFIYFKLKPSPTPSVTPTNTVTPTKTITPTPTNTITPTVTPTTTPTPTSSSPLTPNSCNFTFSATKLENPISTLTNSILIDVILYSDNYPIRLYQSTKNVSNYGQFVTNVDNSSSRFIPKTETTILTSFLGAGYSYSLNGTTLFYRFGINTILLRETYPDISIFTFDLFKVYYKIYGGGSSIVRTSLKHSKLINVPRNNGFDFSPVDPTETNYFDTLVSPEITSSNKDGDLIKLGYFVYDSKKDTIKFIKA